MPELAFLHHSQAKERELAKAEEGAGAAPTPHNATSEAPVVDNGTGKAPVADTKAER